ncbi:integrase [Nitrobacteraceae bacterium AZCC 2146]
MRLAIAMDDWSEAVRRAQAEDPEQPDRALLRRMLDDAMALVESERSIAATRRQADALQAAVREYKITSDLRNRLPDIGARLGAINDRVASLKATTAKASTSAIADLRADLMNEIAKVRDDVQNAHKNQWSADPMSSKIDGYIAAKIKELGDKSKHATTLKPRLDIFVATVGDKPLRDYTRADFEEYRDVLDQVPVKALDRFKTDDFRVAIKLNSKRLKPFAIISEKTVNDDYLTPVKTLFTYCLRHNWIPSHPAIGVVSARTRDSRRNKRADEARSPFSLDQINAYFRYVAKKRSRATPDYWLPILALYTGARLNELCQIEIRRIIMHNGRWHVDLLTIFDEDEIEQALKEQKISENTATLLKLKTASARRQIPVHDDLVAAGFIEFVNERRKVQEESSRLFPRLKADKHGYYSNNVGRRLNNDIERAGAKASKTSFYSLRHSFADACVDGKIPDRIKDRYMGHLIEGAQGVYGLSALKPAETRAIRRIRFPGVDISPYLPRKRI